MKVNGNSIPKRMKAIRQQKAGGTLSFEEVEVPHPGPGEVLVKMDAAPVNPSDLAVLKGGYLERSYPFTPGLEGSGTVVAAGSGLFPRLRLGSRVACSPKQGGDGTWADYMLTSAMNVAPLPKQISSEQGAMMLVNPMTAMAFMQMVREGKHKAMVNNAAASSLGKMLIRLSISRGIPLINIVRKEEHVSALKALGAIHVLITEEKKIVGFQLGNWLQTKGLLFKLRFVNSVKNQLGNELSSHISHTYPLEHAGDAVSHYRAHMSEGKILLKIGS